jgi:hypothetical protein
MTWTDAEPVLAGTAYEALRGGVTFGYRCRTSLEGPLEDVRVDRQLDGVGPASSLQDDLIGIHDLDDPYRSTHLEGPAKRRRASQSDCRRSLHEPGCEPGRHTAVTRDQRSTEARIDRDGLGHFSLGIDY